MATIIWTASVDGNVENEANYNSQTLPASGDLVIVSGSNSGGTMPSTGTAIQGVNWEFLDNASNGAILNGSCIFSGDGSINNGTIILFGSNNQTCTFSGSSAANVAGTIYATNTSGVTNANVIFSEYSYNNDTIVIDGGINIYNILFSGHSHNEYGVTGNCSFGGSSSNTGEITGNAQFTSPSYAGEATINGEVEFVGYDKLQSDPDKATSITYTDCNFVYTGSEDVSADTFSYVFNNCKFSFTDSATFSGDTTLPLSYFSGTSSISGSGACKKAFFEQTAFVGNNSNLDTVFRIADIIDANGTNALYTFSDNAKNNGYTPHAKFYDFSHNEKSTGHNQVLGMATFYDNSYNAGLLDDDQIAFNDSSYNEYSLTTTNVVNFNDSSYNNGTVINALFSGTSHNDLVITTATFTQTAYNNGTVSGNVTWNEITGNFPATNGISGTQTFTNCDFHYNGSQEFTLDTTNYTFTGTNRFNFSGTSENKGNIAIGSGSFTQTAINSGTALIGYFSDTARNTGTITETGYFSGSSANSGTITGTNTGFFRENSSNTGDLDMGIFYDNSSMVSGSAETALFYNYSTLKGGTIGTVYLNNSAIAYGGTVITGFGSNASKIYGGSWETLSLYNSSIIYGGTTGLITLYDSAQDLRGGPIYFSCDKFICQSTTNKTCVSWKQINNAYVAAVTVCNQNL